MRAATAARASGVASAVPATNAPGGAADAARPGDVRRDRFARRKTGELVGARDERVECLVVARIRRRHPGAAVDDRAHADGRVVDVDVLVNRLVGEARERGAIARNRHFRGVGTRAPEDAFRERSPRVSVHSRPRPRRCGSAPGRPPASCGPLGSVRPFRSSASPTGTMTRRRRWRRTRSRTPASRHHRSGS